MGELATSEALQDAWLPYHLLEHAYVGYVYGDSTSGQAALYNVGLSGLPVVNVNNNCASGSSALWLAAQAVASGAAECVLALGFEEMRPGSPGPHRPDRPDPLRRFDDVLRAAHEYDERAPRTPRYFAAAALSYLDRYGLQPETLARIMVKARRHAANNPYAVFRTLVTEDEVLAAPRIAGPLTRPQCCPPTSGAAAAILCSDAFAHRHGIRERVVIRAQAMLTDGPATFADRDPTSLVGYDLTRDAARRAYESAGVGPEDIQVVELHDCSTVNELISYEALGLTPEGTAEKLVLDGDNTYGGRVVVNPSGGLLSKGHPLGATGLAQCVELVWQLRGQANARQVRGARLGLQHNLGLGGACVVTLYEKRD